jgi:hypothetical protein
VKNIALTVNKLRVPDPRIIITIYTAVSCCCTVVTGHSNYGSTLQYT